MREMKEKSKSDFYMQYPSMLDYYGTKMGIAVAVVATATYLWLTDFLAIFNVESYLGSIGYYFVFMPFSIIAVGALFYVPCKAYLTSFLFISIFKFRKIRESDLIDKKKLVQNYLTTPEELDKKNLRQANIIILVALAWISLLLLYNNPSSEYSLSSLYTIWMLALILPISVISAALIRVHLFYSLIIGMLLFFLCNLSPNGIPGIGDSGFSIILFNILLAGYCLTIPLAFNNISFKALRLDMQLDGELEVKNLTDDRVEFLVKYLQDRDMKLSRGSTLDLLSKGQHAEARELMRKRGVFTRAEY